MKETLISGAIALGVFVTLVAFIKTLDKVKPANEEVSSVATEQDDMTSHHAPPALADTSAFQALLFKSAPEFTLESYDGETVTLASLKGKNVVLFFSEGAMCYPGCWDQVDAFGKDEEMFANANTVVLTIVVDPKTEWAEAVRQDPKLTLATVLLDTDRKVSTDYGVLTVDSSMHRGQFPGHTYVIIDTGGVVRYQFDDEQMGVRNKDLLAEIATLP